MVTSIICAVMVSTYTNYMKKYSVLGNLAVSVGVWLGFLYGDLVFDFQIDILPESLASAAFMLNFGREVAKGIIDVEGDRENNVTTVATALGPRWTSIIASLFFILAIGAGIVPIFFAGASIVYVCGISVIIFLDLVITIWLLISQKHNHIRKMKTIVLFVMLLSLIVFALEALYGPNVGPLFP
ncbi:MAG: hypothetical protein FK734_11690 [Asgard group archaeon]|nr:hypothetical protein [Asgard group archaeon]